MIGILKAAVDYLPAGSFVVWRGENGGECQADGATWLDCPASVVVEVPEPADLIGYSWSVSKFRDGGRWSMVSRDVALVAKGYLDAALWAEIDCRYQDGEEVEGDDYYDRPFDTWADAWSCSERLLCHCLETARAFVSAHRDDFLAYCAAESVGWRDGGPEEWFGHDLWLTRGGHGAGFWDRGLGGLGERLSEAAGSLGEAWLYSVPVDGATDEIEEREVTI